MRIIILLIAFVTYVLSTSPNIVFVLVDDVGWGDVNYTTGGMVKQEKSMGIYEFPSNQTLIFQH